MYIIIIILFRFFSASFHDIKYMWKYLYPLLPMSLRVGMCVGRWLAAMSVKGANVALIGTLSFTADSSLGKRKPPTNNIV